MNEDVYKMINTLHARLDDVRGAVDKLSGEAPEYVGKLDKIDDKLYLLQCEIEKVAAQAQQDSGNSEDEQKTSSSEAPSADSSNAATNETNEAQAVESKNDSEKSNKAATSSAEATDEADGSDKKKEIFTDDMKENLADAGRAIGNIYRDGKEVITELSGTMGDLKDIFSFGKKR